MITLVERTRAATALRTAAFVFVLAVLVHNSDHLRRGGSSVSAGVFWLGSAGMIAEIAVVAMVLGRHRLAPHAAALIGAALALGYLVVHFTPARPWLSDSFLDTAPAVISLAAAGLETAAATALAASGVVALRSGVGVDGGTPSVAGMLRHPVVVLFAIGNLAIFIGSLATR